MSEVPYSNREINRLFGEVKEQLNRIEEQTTKTNGNVRALQKWRAYTAGALAVIVFAVLPLVVYVFQLQVTQVEARIIKNESTR